MLFLKIFIMNSYYFHSWKQFTLAISVYKEFVITLIYNV